MRHHMAGKRLGRDTGHRKALRLNLTRALLTHERIETTLAKAQFVRANVERTITLAKRGLAKAEASQRPGGRRACAPLGRQPARQRP